MIPKYPFAVVIEYQGATRQTKTAHRETLPGAMAVYNEHVGKPAVRRVTVSMVIEQSERSEQAHR